MNRIDLSGKRFGRWLVIDYSGPRKPGIATAGSTWRCRCDCGTERSGVPYASLTTGNSKSCGCYRREKNRGPLKYPNKPQDHHDIYHIWQSIKTRCYNTEHPSFRLYGARGITMCDLWMNDFMRFYNDIGPRPSKSHSIDRIKNDGNYEPGNTRWTTRSPQMMNTRANRLFPHQGEHKPLTAICRIENVRYSTMYQRTILKQDTLDEAIQYCRQRRLTFFERAAEFGSHKDNRITSIKRKRRTNQEISTLVATTQLT